MYKSFLALVLTVAAAQPVPAQSISYSTDKGLRLRYHERTDSFLRITARQETFEQSGLHDATIAISFVAPDTAHASNESLLIRDASAEGVTEPDTSPVIGEPFVLYFPNDGQVETLSTPSFPSSFEQVTNLSFQFEDFFVKLPDDVLVIGTTWSDADVSGSIDDMRVETNSTFEVVGDTTLYGHEALVINYRSNLSYASEGEGPSPGITVIFSSEGVETGRFYFAPEPGIFVGRDRRAELNGEFEYVGAAQPIVMTQKRTYESTIKLLK